MANAKAKKVEMLSADAAKTMEAGVETVTKSMENAANFGQGNLEALVKASKISVKAAESMSGEIAAFSKKSYEDGLAAAKELSACRSVTEFAEKQASIAKTSAETFIGEAARLNEMYAAAAKEVMAPLNARFAAAVNVFKDIRA
jgi:phasin family protein